jgi:hypothetical protein
MMLNLPLLYLGKVLLNVWKEDSIVKLYYIAVDGFFLVGNFDFVD